jgi:protein TonB
MKPKKSDKVNLEKRRLLFFEIGMITALSMILIAFEWSDRNFGINEFELTPDEPLEVEVIPLTPPNKPNPPKPPLFVEELRLMPNEVELPEEAILPELTANESTEVIPISYDLPEDTGEDEDSIFIFVQDMPKFLGKDVNAFRIWVTKHLKYPRIAAENRIMGTVHIRFVIESDGSVGQVEVIRSVDPSLDAEAVRVVSSSPHWTPGKQRGKPVRVAYTIPITFILQ